jgi:putative endonuclease
MFRGGLTRATLRLLDGICDRILPANQMDVRHSLGQRGELEAYFFLREQGYVMVARNFRSPRRRGEIDLIGWDGHVLCFIEVKSRRSREGHTAEAAADKKKRQDVISVAREYLNHLPPACPWRFDLVTVYWDGTKHMPKCELFKDVLPL